MFSAQTPMRLHGCNGKTKKDNEGNRKRVVLLTFMLQPFTPEMAAALNVKGRLFNVNTGQPLEDIQSISLKIAVPLQQMSLSPARDVAAEVVVAETEVIGLLKVSADREGPIYTAYFSVEFDYPSANDLLWLFHKVTEQIVATFEPVQGDMLSDGTQPAKLTRKSSRRKQDQPELAEEAADVEEAETVETE